MFWRAVVAVVVLVGVVVLASVIFSDDDGDDPVAVESNPPAANAVVGEVSAAFEESVEADQEVREQKVLQDAGELESLLNGFWVRELGREGVAFDPPDGFWYYRSGETEPSCGGEPAESRNAHYCFADGEEHVAFDLDWFQEYLIENPEGATTFLILAHEWGHAVQDSWLESGGADRWERPNQELDADCLAGVFLAQSIREGTIIEEPGDARAIFNWLYEAGAEPSTSPWTEPSSHGTREQRQAAFSDGYTRDTNYCRTTY